MVKTFGPAEAVKKLLEGKKIYNSFAYKCCWFRFDNGAICDSHDRTDDRELGEFLNGEYCEYTEPVDYAEALKAMVKGRRVANINDESEEVIYDKHENGVRKINYRGEIIQYDVTVYDPFDKVWRILDE